MPPTLTPRDLAELAARGISEAEAERQLALLRHPPRALRLVRPATVGDGILRLDPERQAALADLGRAAALAGRISRFVPASGAASRMFASLLAVRRGEANDEDREVLAIVLAGLDRLPFAAELRAEAGDAAWAAARAGDPLPVLAALLDPERLAYGDRPKGLVPFHRENGRVRAPFEEHLAEAAEHGRDDAGRARLHFTVAPEHRAAFEHRWESARSALERLEGARFEVGFSEQSPATDTLATTPGGEPFRRADGRLLLRPGGHGALLGNLAGSGGDLIVIKNVDNVLPRGRRNLVLRWKAILVGLLAELLDRPDTPADRPVRVCAVVAHRGEPGGGPFWVEGRDGRVSLQIVETSQVDRSAPGQAEVLAASTHFNPVDMVVRVRDRENRPFPLISETFVDDQAAFVAPKTHEGSPLLALERPGLWNGGMSGWTTVFVEVPAATFAPVKTVVDLLRPEHQP